MQYHPLGSAASLSSWMILDGDSPLNPLMLCGSLGIPLVSLGAMPPSSLMGSLAVAGAAVATTLSLQWLWARATARVRRGRKGYSSIDAAKDAEVVKGAPWQPWGGSFQHCLKIIVRYLKIS